MIRTGSRSYVKVGTGRPKKADRVKFFGLLADGRRTGYYNSRRRVQRAMDELTSRPEAYWLVAVLQTTKEEIGRSLISHAPMTRKPAALPNGRYDGVHL